MRVVVVYGCAILFVPIQFPSGARFPSRFTRGETCTISFLASQKASTRALPKAATPERVSDNLQKIQDDVANKLERIKSRLKTQPLVGCSSNSEELCQMEGIDLLIQEVCKTQPMLQKEVRQAFEQLSLDSQCILHLSFSETVIKKAWQVFWLLAAQSNAPIILSKKCNNLLQQGDCSSVFLAIQSIAILFAKYGTQGKVFTNIEELAIWVKNLNPYCVPALSMKALKSGVNYLAKPQNQALSDDDLYAMRAVCNQLFDDHSFSPIDEMNQRLSKVATWGQRAQSAKGSIWTLWKKNKSPFHAAYVDHKNSSAFNLKLQNCLMLELEGFKGSSKLQWQDSRTFGGSTNMLISGVSYFFSGTLLRLRLLFRLAVGRRALFELNMGPVSLDITFGVSKVKNKASAVGLAAGPQFGVASVGASVQILNYERDQQTLNGVCLRIPRRIHGRSNWGDQQARDMAQAVMARLLDSSDKQTRWVERLLIEFPLLSITHLSNVSEQSSQLNSSIEGFVNIGLSPVKLCGVLGLNFTHFSRRRLLQLESTGRRFVNKFREALSRSLSGVAMLRAPFQSEQAGGGRLQHGLGQMAGVNCDLLSSDDVTRQEVIYEDGFFSDKSYFEIEHDDPQAFLNTLERMLDLTAPPKKIDRSFNLISKTMQSENTKMRYGQRYQLTSSAVTQLNNLLAEENVLQNQMLNGSVFEKRKALSDIKQKMCALLANLNNYRLASLRVYTKGMTRRRMNLDIGFLMDRAIQSSRVEALSGSSSFPSKSKHSLLAQ